jgi:hypothetical protein
MNATLVLALLLGALESDPSCALSQRFDVPATVGWTSCGPGCARLDVDALPDAVGGGIFDLRARGDLIALSRETTDGFALTVVDTRAERVVFEARRQSLGACRVELAGFTPDGPLLMVSKGHSESRYLVDLVERAVRALGGTSVDRAPLELVTDGHRVALTRDRRSIEVGDRRFAPGHAGLVVGPRFAGRDLLFARVQDLGGGRLFALRDGVEAPVHGAGVVGGLATNGNDVAYFERAATGWYLVVGRYAAGTVERVRRVRRAPAPSPGILAGGFAAHLVDGRIVITNLEHGGTTALRAPPPLEIGVPLHVDGDAVVAPLYAPAAWRRSGRVGPGRAYGVARLEVTR